MLYSLEAFRSFSLSLVFWNFMIESTGLFVSYGFFNLEIDVFQFGDFFSSIVSLKNPSTPFSPLPLSGMPVSQVEVLVFCFMKFPDFIPNASTPGHCYSGDKAGQGDQKLYQSVRRLSHNSCSFSPTPHAFLLLGLESPHLESVRVTFSRKQTLSLLWGAEREEELLGCCRKGAACLLLISLFSALCLIPAFRSHFCLLLSPP